MTAEGPTPVQSADVLGKGKVVLFAVPGAFTPTCSDHHLPGFVLRAEELAAKGVDTIACVAVNDAVRHGRLGRGPGHRRQGARCWPTATASSPPRSASRSTAAGSASAPGRSATPPIIDDGVVTELMVEPGPGLEASSADSVLDKL